MLCKVTCHPLKPLSYKGPLGKALSQKHGNLVPAELITKSKYLFILDGGLFVIIFVPAWAGRPCTCLEVEVTPLCFSSLPFVLASGLCSYKGNLVLVNATLMRLRWSSDLTAHFSTTVSFPPVEAHQVVITYLGLFLQTIFT